MICQTGNCLLCDLERTEPFDLARTEPAFERYQENALGLIDERGL